MRICKLHANGELSIQRILAINKRLLVFAISLILHFQCHSQNFRYENWQSGDGLAQNSVKNIIQDNEGFLWISTEGGLCKFDGVSFTNYGQKSDSVLKSNRMGTLFYNENDDLLFWNAQAGLILKRDDKFFSIPNALSTVDRRIWKLKRCTKDLILVENYTKGFSLIDAETYRAFNHGAFQLDESPLNIFVREEYNIWVFESHLEILDHNLSPYPVDVPLDIDLPISSAAFDSGSNTLWICSQNKLQQFSDLKLSNTFELPVDLVKTGTNQLIHSNERLYISNSATQNIYAFDNQLGKFQLYTSAKNLCPEGVITQVFVDREENFWIGTTSCGLIKLKPSRISYLDKSEWNIKKNFFSIVKDDSGSFYLGGIEFGILKIDKAGNKVTDPTLGFIENRAQNSIQFHKGAQYVSGFNDNFIWKSKNEKLTRIYYPDSLPSQKNAIYSSPSGKLLVPSYYGYFELVNEQFITHNIVQGESIGFVSYFKETSDGNLWIASADMLLSVDQDTDEILFDSRKELPHVLGYREIVEDSEGRLFIGTYGHGFVVIENQKTHHIDEENGLIDNTVSTITEDTYGNVWLTGNKGLVKLPKKEILDLVNGGSNVLNPVLYNEKTDALRSSEFNGGHQHSKCKIDENSYVFSSMKGAVIVDFTKMQKSNAPPPILIESLVYNDSIYLDGNSMNPNYSGGRLDINFTSTSFVSSEKIEFTYKLDGYDTDWVKGGNQRKASYGKLPPGAFTFLVKAKSFDGVWSESPASYTFRIVPPFYMTSWFRGLLVLLSIFITALIVNLVNVRKRKLIAIRQSLQLEAILVTEEKERKRIAADLHDGVGQLLSSVKLNMGIVEDKITAKKVNESVKMVRKSKMAIDEIITEIRNISYNLLPPSLEQFGLGMAISEEVSKLKDNPNLHVHFDQAIRDTKFDPKIEIVLFRVFQELLNNAIKHANGTEITIQLIQHEKSLILMIEDDGDGYNLQKAFRKVDSSGLKNIYSRVKYIHGTINVDSKIGQGANTLIEIPL